MYKKCGFKPHFKIQMKEYLSLSGEFKTEKIIEKSRFITVSKHIEGERQAKDFISSVAADNPYATHNCYAYVCDKQGNFIRFSDDGEPQGTAGMPMLEVLKSNNLREAAVVVARYFGGIKLGAGGLVRAYSGCVAENLRLAPQVVYTPCVGLKCTVDYSAASAAQRYFAYAECLRLSADYLGSATFGIAVKLSEKETFCAGLKNALNGKVKIEEEGESFYPFTVKK